jgi:hypothetical protein
MGTSSRAKAALLVLAFAAAPARLVALWWPWIDDAPLDGLGGVARSGVGLFWIAVVLGAPGEVVIDCDRRERESRDALGFDVAQPAARVLSSTRRRVRARQVSSRPRVLVAREPREADVRLLRRDRLRLVSAA